MSKKKKKPYYQPSAAFFAGEPLGCNRCGKALTYIDDSRYKDHWDKLAAACHPKQLFPVECKHCCYHVFLQVVRHFEYII